MRHLSLTASTLLISLSILSTPASAAFENTVNVKQLEGTTVRSKGSGAYLGGNLYLTAFHVVSSVGQGLTTTVTDHDGLTFNAEVVKVDQKKDLALLKIVRADPKPGAAFTCEAPEVGTDLTTEGHPIGINWVLSKGVAASEPRSFTVWESIYLTDLTALPGSSGGPVFNASGELAGILVGVIVSPGVPGIGIPGVSGYSTVVSPPAICEFLNVKVK